MRGRLFSKGLGNGFGFSLRWDSVDYVSPSDDGNSGRKDDGRSVTVTARVGGESVKYF